LPSASHRYGRAGRTEGSAGRAGSRRNPPRQPAAVWLQPFRPVSGLAERRRMRRRGGTPSHAVSAQWQWSRRTPESCRIRGLRLPLRGQRRFFTCFPFHSTGGRNTCKVMMPAQRRRASRPFPRTRQGLYARFPRLARRVAPSPKACRGRGFGGGSRSRSDVGGIDNGSQMLEFFTTCARNCCYRNATRSAGIPSRSCESGGSRLRYAGPVMNSNTVSAMSLRASASCATTTRPAREITDISGRTNMTIPSVTRRSC
jgi:hypothetical protein